MNLHSLLERTILFPSKVGNVPETLSHPEVPFPEGSFLVLLLLSDFDRELLYRELVNSNFLLLLTTMTPALHMDYFDLLASLALTVICQSFYNARFCWLPALVGLLTRVHHFLICWAWTNQVSVLLSSLAVWLELLLFLHDCHIMATVVFLAAGGGEELLFRVVVKRVLMMLWWSGSSSF